MPLSIERNTSQDQSKLIQAVNQKITEMNNQPKDLAWLMKNPLDQITKPLKYVSRLDQKFQFKYSSLASRKEQDNLMKKHTFISLLFFYKEGHATTSQVYIPSIQPYTALYLISDKTLAATIENIKNIISPTPFLILVSKNLHYMDHNSFDEDFNISGISYNYTMNKHVLEPITSQTSKIISLLQNNQIHQEVSDLINNPKQDPQKSAPILFNNIQNYINEISKLDSNHKSEYSASIHNLLMLFIIYYQRYQNADQIIS